MNLLILTDYYPPEVGGAAHLMSDLSRGMARRGHDVTVATGMPRYNLPETPERYRRRLRVRETVDGVRIVRTLGLPTYGRSPVVRALSHFFSGAAHFAGGLAGPRPDVVFALSPPLTEGLAAHAVRRFRGGAFVLNVQDLFPQNAIDLGVLRNAGAIRFFETMERYDYRCADAIVVHSEGNRKYLVERKGVAPEKIHTMHNWVDTDWIRPGERMNAFRSEHGLDDKFLVTFAGVMGWSQGLDVIIDAAQRLSDDPDLMILMVGEGVEKPRLEQRTRELGLDNVRFLPMQPRERYPLVLEASDAGLVTLHDDVKTPVVPSKILSILAAGRPVLASMPLEGDAPGIIRESDTGFCVGAGDAEALAGAVRRLLSDRSLVRAMGERARRTAEERFSLEGCLTRYEDLFSSAAETRKG